MSESKQDKVKQTLPDFSTAQYYFNRELSWLAFNQRVLEEAVDQRNPLLERLKFLAILSSNLDEFFMVRVAGIKDQIKAGFNKPENKAGLTPREQLKAISKETHKLMHQAEDALTESLLPALKEEGIELLKMNQLSSEQYQYVESLFDARIFPVLTPLAIDAYRPFPKLLNKSLNLAVVLKASEREANKKHVLAIVQVPLVLGRFIKLPSKKKRVHFILLEDLISHFIGKLFVGYEVQSVSPFRITRNADLMINEEGARDLLSEIEKELKNRERGAAVRLEYRRDLMDETIYHFFKSVLNLAEDDIYASKSILDYTFFFEFVDTLTADYEHLVYETLIPKVIEPLLDEPNIFEAALKEDLYFHHPYDSFQPVIDLITQAAKDPDVLAIKQTLYRVSGDSPIVQALEKAAENKKQVTVLVELKARFDEENNIHWAKRLERAGVHVIYGITGLKTHSKITLLVKQVGEEVRRYVHLSTGNYNEKTAKVYTDMSILTTNEKFGIDATNFFNYLSGYTEQPHWHYFVNSPHLIKKELLSLIDEEIKAHEKTKKGRIILKMNAMTDKDLMMKLYEASYKGVKIDLIIRGICCIKPGIEGVSENIRVRSIVGRFLEHSRIYYFNHQGEEKLYLSSADWMTRNMERRIEIMFPICSAKVKKQILAALTLFLNDNVKARGLSSDGKYHYIKASGEELSSQASFIK